MFLFKMNIVKQFPVIKLLFAFIIGILLVNFLPLAYNSLILLLSTFIVLFLIHLFYSRLFVSIVNQWIYGLFALIAFVLLGITNALNFKQITRVDHFSNYLNDSVFTIVRVIEPPLEKQNTIKLVLEAEYMFVDGKFVAVDGQSMAYMALDSCSRKLSYGDVFICNTRFDEVKKPTNPHQFNYKSYLANLEIYHQAYIPAERWRIIPFRKVNRIFELGFTIRDRFIDIFSANGLVNEEFAVATALVLGYDDKISAELKQEYSNVGVIHILSVSGLHVGIVFFILSNIFAFLKRKKQTRFLHILLVLLGIWFFSLISGLSPSVLRSATMFSFVSFASVINRKSNIYNTLALSAFFLIVINPNLVYDIGFQLSYLAVIGIVSIQPLIVSAYSPRNWLVKQVWLIVSVSLAAQLSTLPVSLYYFNQFPNYFLLANLIVIPLSTIILYLGILLIVCSPLSWLAFIVGKALIFVVFALNQTISFFDNLPYAISQGIVINAVQVLCIFVIVLLIYKMLSFFRKSYLFLTISMLIVVFAIGAFNKIKALNHSYFIIYDVYKHSAIEFVSKCKNTTFLDSSLLKSSKTLEFATKSNHTHLRLHDSQVFDISTYTYLEPDFDLTKHSDYFKFKNLRIGVLDKTNMNKMNHHTRLKLDYLIIRDNPQLRFEELQKQYDFGMIIFDSSNFKAKIEKWALQCREMNLNFYSVPHQGAFVLDL